MRNGPALRCVVKAGARDATHVRHCNRLSWSHRNSRPDQREREHRDRSVERTDTDLAILACSGWGRRCRRRIDSGWCGCKRELIDHRAGIDQPAVGAATARRSGRHLNRCLKGDDTSRGRRFFRFSLISKHELSGFGPFDGWRLGKSHRHLRQCFAWRLLTRECRAMQRSST
jgi:hypothetical protein